MGCRSPQHETNADAPPQAPCLSERPDEQPMGGDEPMIPDAAPGGRPRRAAKREIVEAIAVSAARRLFMAAASARFPPVADGLPLSAPLGGRRPWEGL
jgi:hypothetical protein